jgi:hypothetical protein
MSITPFHLSLLLVRVVVDFHPNYGTLAQPQLGHCRLRHDPSSISVPPVRVASKKEHQDLTETLHEDVGLSDTFGWMTYIDELAISRIWTISVSPPPSRHSSFPPSAARFVKSLDGFPKLILADGPGHSILGYPASKFFVPRVPQDDTHMPS